MRYSHFKGKENGESKYSPRRASGCLQALACEREVTLLPVACHAFFADLFRAVKWRIDGDLVLPELPFRYVSADEEGTVAVVSLLYAAMCRQVKRVSLRTETTDEAFFLFLEGTPLDGRASSVPALFRETDGERSVPTLLRCVAQNSGIALSYTAGERLSLCLRFARYVAEIQVVHAADETQFDRMAGYMARLLPLANRRIL